MNDSTQSVNLVPCTACRRVNPEGANFCAFCGVDLAHPEHKRATPDEPEVSADPLVGRVIADRYRILSVLGRGGMGVVYKIEHVAIHKLMAMKLLAGNLATDREVVKRFIREAETISKLSHPNTVQTFDFGRSEGLMYLVMEFLAGRDLGTVIAQEGPLPFERVAQMCVQVCGSVGEAHEQGIVHRDLKPENLMVLEGRDKKDFIKVLDFGLAKLRESDEAGASLTHAGHILGTPYYMAPEHIRGETVDRRSDIYAVGALMYKAVSGVPPFYATSPMAVLTKHLTEEAIAPSMRLESHSISPEADAIILKAMAKSPADRYQRMEELRDDLTAYLAAAGLAPSESGSRPRTDQTGRSTARKALVATRGDIDRYERSLRRRSWGSYAMGLVIVSALGLGGFELYRQKGGSMLPPPDSEVEPNDAPGTANELTPGVSVRGQIGRRAAEHKGDADVYRIGPSTDARRSIRFLVTAIESMDLAVDVVQAGHETPLLTIDSGGIGEPEQVPNFPLTGSAYLLQVREAREQCGFPTENISDFYRIDFGYVVPEANDEREINDSLEQSEVIGAPGEKRGFIGWEGDVDTYCLAANATAIDVVLEPVAELDLVLRVVDRTTGRSRKLDVNDASLGERAEAFAPARAGTTCIEVSVDPDSTGLRANADRPYTLRVDTGLDGAPTGEPRP